MPAAPQQATILQDAFGQQISLPPGRYSIGRDKTNALCLYNDPQVSPSHAEIFVTPTTVTIVDNGSATGTRVNGAPVSHPVALHPGDTLEFGASRFTYVR
jgi:pSer/pThr/pTyr-binding forkhead associated (FHA) protein